MLEQESMSDQEFNKLLTQRMREIGMRMDSAREVKNRQVRCDVVKARARKADPTFDFFEEKDLYDTYVAAEKFISYDEIRRLL